jgi:xanthosine utilization system XapX-like protein
MVTCSAKSFCGSYFPVRSAAISSRIDRPLSLDQPHPKHPSQTKYVLQSLSMEDPVQEPAPSIIRYVIGFLMIGIAWGFTTPFIRAAARTHKPPPHPILDSEAVKKSWFKSKIYGAFFGVIDLLKNPKYAIPLVINLTGSVWFFLLIGKAGD